MDIREFWKKIDLSSEVIEKALQLNIAEPEYQRLRLVYKQKHQEFFDEVLKKENSPMWFLYLYSRMACEVYFQYQECGISDEIFQATFNDISYWCDNYQREYGSFGLGEYGWFTRHLDMTLLRLGRLQFEEMEMEYTVGDGEDRIEKGTPVINIHIPQGEPLIWDECEKSISMARERWGIEKRYVCHSWLLYPDLSDVLSEHSNIREFARHFKVLRTDFNEREAEWRIFGKVLKNVIDYPETTGLQRNAKKYLLEGNCLGNGWAVLESIF